MAAVLAAASAAVSAAARSRSRKEHGGLWFNYPPKHLFGVSYSTPGDLGRCWTALSGLYLYGRGCKAGYLRPQSID